MSIPETPANETQYPAGDQQPVEDAPRTSRGRRRKKGPTDVEGVRRTRIGGAWVTVAISVVLGVGLVDFIVQNTRSVKVEFFGASGRMPVAVALLAAALAGAFIVLAVGIARTTQLRMANRRGKKRQARTEALVTNPPS